MVNPLWLGGFKREARGFRPEWGSLVSMMRIGCSFSGTGPQTKVAGSADFVALTQT